MEFDWEIETNLIWGLNSNLLKQDLKQIKFVYMFDLDCTIIKTKSGKKFPTNKDDWELLYHEVKIKFIELTKSSEILVGIISNQKGLKNQEQKKDWVEKIKQIFHVLKFDFVFASTTDDRFRKPLPGSFDFVKNKLVGVDWNKLLEGKKVYYIGDAFGRKEDFSDTDIKYAINNNFKFKTPEIFFNRPNKNDLQIKTGSIDYPQISYFTPEAQTRLFEELDKIIEHNKKIIILIIGFPASGKSFLRKELIKKYPQFSYSNNDDINNKIQSKSLVKKISTKYDFIIDDNTNLEKLSRDFKLKEFESYYKIGIWFNYELDICFHLNWMRMYWYGGKLIPKVTYYTLRKKFDSIDLEKGFDKFITINKVFKEFNLEFNMDSGIKYYY